MRYISPTDCKSRLKNQEIEIIDIREKYEYDICNSGFKHLPMAEVHLNIENLPKDRDCVIMCRSGKRAESVVNLLETEFKMTNLLVLEGGLVAWAEQIDKTIQID
jgi:rhodanese-related sulfurtransferase